MKPRAWGKKAVYGTFFALGLPAAGRWRRRSGLIVLTYHSFGDPREYPYVGRLSSDLFEKQLDHLERNYEIVGIEEGINSLEREIPRNRPMLALTVDDGYYDNRDLFFSAVRDRSLPGTIFVATDYLDSGMLPWPTRVNAILLYATRRIMERPFKLDLNDPASNQIIKRHLARLSTETRNDLLDTLEDELAPTAIPRIPPLTWDAVREMSASKIAIGSHTVHHGWLDGIPSDEAEEELVHSRERIEAEIGKPCRLIAYPNGNWNNSVVELAKKSGYNYALTQDRGINRALDFSPYSIKRIEIPYNETIESFACRVSGLAI